MQQKYNKGPWRIASKNKQTQFYVIHAPDGNHGREVQIVKFDFGEHPIQSQLDRVEANAKLVAAAPELLESLIRLRNLYGRTRLRARKEAWDKAELAIQKALK